MSKIILKMLLTVIVSFFGTLAVTGSTFASADYSLFGTASYVSPGHDSLRAVQTTSTGFSTYGGINFVVPSGLTLYNLNTLITEFNVTSGECGGGSPRFSVTVTTPSNTSENIFFYLGTAPSYTCQLNTWMNSGNLATSTNLVDATQLGGGFYEPYSQVQADYGNDVVTNISLVNDGGWAVGGTQTVLFDNTVINNSTYKYEPTKDDCKDGGWKTLVDQNGNAFKNQGDCVSYLNSINPG